MFRNLGLPGYREVCELVAKLADNLRGGCVLDVACGTGPASLPLAEKAPEVVG